VRPPAVHARFRPIVPPHLLFSTSLLPSEIPVCLPATPPVSSFFLVHFIFPSHSAHFEVSPPPPIFHPPPSCQYYDFPKDAPPLGPNAFFGLEAWPPSLRLQSPTIDLPQLFSPRRRVLPSRFSPKTFLLGPGSLTSKPLFVPSDSSLGFSTSVYLKFSPAPYQSSSFSAWTPLEWC